MNTENDLQLNIDDKDKPEELDTNENCLSLNDILVLDSVRLLNSVYLINKD
jgi:hypothetical protein